MEQAAPANEEQIAHWIKTDPLRWQVLAIVRSLDLPDCWVGAGFVRDLIWAKLHDQEAPLSADIDVIWFDPSRATKSIDRTLERELMQVTKDFEWSVKNQARMHTSNRDAPYTSSGDAMRHWAEVSAAIAVRRTKDDECEICAPYGVSDLFSLIVRPTPDFIETKRNEFDERVARKQWLSRFPKLKVVG
ncbi:MAG: nucleotidyltransferase family protein [Erythrobacter sp.]